MAFAAALLFALAFVAGLAFITFFITLLFALAFAAALLFALAFVAGLAFITLFITLLFALAFVAGLAFITLFITLLLALAFASPTLVFDSAFATTTKCTYLNVAQWLSLDNSGSKKNEMKRNHAKSMMTGNWPPPEDLSMTAPSVSPGGQHKSYPPTQ